MPDCRLPEDAEENPEAKCKGCGKLFFCADDYDTLGSDSGVICPDCGSENFEDLEEVNKMDPKPERKIVIEPRGNSYLIYHYRYVLDGVGGWKLVDELIRGPVGYPDGETLFDAQAYAEEQRIRFGVFLPVEVR